MIQNTEITNTNINIHDTNINTHNNNTITTTVVKFPFVLVSNKADKGNSILSPSHLSNVNPSRHLPKILSPKRNFFQKKKYGSEGGYSSVESVSVRYSQDKIKETIHSLLPNILLRREEERKKQEKIEKQERGKGRVKEKEEEEEEENEKEKENEKENENHQLEVKMETILMEPTLLFNSLRNFLTYSLLLSFLTLSFSFYSLE